MAAEILYLHDLEVEALIPSLIASIVGYSIYGAFFGYTPIFGAQPQLGFDHPIQLLYYAALGVICGLVGLLYSRSFYGLTDVFHKIKLPRWFKPAIGGVIVGLIGIVLPGALHMGYGWVQLGMTRDQLLSFPFWVVLLLPFAKILSTSLSIGSGGSGGIFGPGMVIGGLLGAAFWRLSEGFLPQMPTEPAPFVIIGMMALFGGIAHAPLAVMLMVAEMTGNLSLLAPAMVAVAISTALVGDKTIYSSQLPTRADSPAHRVRFSFPLLSSLLVRDAISPPGPTIEAGAPLADAQTLLSQDGAGGVIVLGDQDGTDGTFLGVVTPEKLRRIPPDELARTPARSVISGHALTLGPNETLQDALEKLSDRTLSWAPVVENKRLIGRLTARNIMQVYKATLQRSVKRTQTLTENTAMFEAQIGPASMLAGRSLRDISWPPNSLVVSVNRGGETIFPRANTSLEMGDRLLVMADVASEQALRSFLEGPPPAD
jgi:CIC family chloride channel protein